MKLSVALLGAAAAVAAAQSVIDYSKIPSCATGCTVLKQAEANCVPPAAPVTSQAIYQSCVCQSTLLATLHSSGALCQQAGCSAADAQSISTYYNNLCNGGVVAPGTSSTLATSTTAAGKATGTQSTKTGTATAAGANLVASQKNSDPTWWDTHKRWVAMIVVVVFGLIFIAIAAGLAKRHYNRKQDAKRANMAAHDAPYNPPTPASKSVYSDGSPAPPMTMSGGLDGGIGGIAAPRGVQRLRSRSNTLQRMSLHNGSKSTLPEPVVWGPHQHLSTAYRTDGSSQVASGPPSPVRAAHGVAAPNQVYRNHDALRSEPRFVSHRPTSDGGLSEDSMYQQGVRPHTAGGAYRDGPRALNAVRSDPTLSPHVEGEAAEFCETSPQKPGPNKLRRHA